MSLLLLEKLKKNKKKLHLFKNEIINWQVNGVDDFTHEVTLTFPYEIYERWQAEKIFGRYKKFLVERCFRRQEGHIKMAVAIEGDGEVKRFHYHCAMRCPHHMSIGYFSYRLDSTWKDVVKNEFARTCIKKYTNSGWLSYMDKEIKLSHTDVISEHTSF